MTKTQTIGSGDTKATTATATLPNVKRGRKGLQCRNLSNEQRASLLQSLLKHRTSGNGTNSETTSHKLRKGALLEASRAFGVSTKTCKRIWERFLETSDASGAGGDVSHRKHQSGRPKKISAEDLVQKITSLPPETRVSVRGLARALGMPHTTIHRRLKSGEIKLESLLCKKSSSTPPSSNDEEEPKLGKTGGPQKPKAKTSAPTTENSNKALGNQKENAKGSKTKSKANVKKQALV